MTTALSIHGLIKRTADLEERLGQISPESLDPTSAPRRGTLVGELKAAWNDLFHALDDNPEGEAPTDNTSEGYLFEALHILRWVGPQLPYAEAKRLKALRHTARDARNSALLVMAASGGGEH